MIKRGVQLVKNYIEVISKAFKLHGYLIQRISQKLTQFQYDKNLAVNFPNFSKDIEVTDMSILTVHKSAVIGNANRFLSGTSDPGAVGNKLSRVQLSENCWTGNGVMFQIEAGNQIIIKRNSTIQDNCKLIGDVTIESNTLLGPGVFLSSGRHYAEKNNPDLIKNQDMVHADDAELSRRHSQPIHIEEDCWIGYDSFVRSGCYIGRGAIVGANSVLTKDVLPYSILGGVPAMKIGQRIDFQPPSLICFDNPDHMPYFYRGFLQNKRDGLYKGGVMQLEGESGVLVLEKIQGRTLVLAGIISQTIPTGISIEISLNSDTVAAVILIAELNGKFNVAIEASEFQPAANIDLDRVFSMMELYNIFKITITEAQGSTSSLLGITSFGYQ